jgi:hypothetical protein
MVVPVVAGIAEKRYGLEFLLSEHAADQRVPTIHLLGRERP